MRSKGFSAHAHGEMRAVRSRGALKSRRRWHIWIKWAIMQFRSLTKEVFSKAIRKEENANKKRSQADACCEVRSRKPAPQDVPSLTFAQFSVIDFRERFRVRPQHSQSPKAIRLCVIDRQVTSSISTVRS